LTGLDIDPPNHKLPHFTPDELLGLTFIRDMPDGSKEQMDFIGSSPAASHSGGKPVILYYNTIGKQGALNSTYMHHLCSERNKLMCVHMKHYRGGFEELTLQRLYEYCLYQGASDSSKVIYIHNKGSFHSRDGTNRRWRTHMMMAVTSELCLNPRMIVPAQLVE
jgi:hypothetical protein